MILLIRNSAEKQDKERLIKLLEDNTTILGLVGDTSSLDIDAIQTANFTQKKPILLRRAPANTLEDLLPSADYIMAEGNKNLILCERGIRTFEIATRNTLDISAIPMLKKLSHLPAVVDPSHAAGNAPLVESMFMAAGADGLIIEAHNNTAATAPNPRPRADYKKVREKANFFIWMDLSQYSCADPAPFPPDTRQTVTRQKSSPPSESAIHPTPCNSGYGR